MKSENEAVMAQKNLILTNLSDNVKESPIPVFISIKINQKKVKPEYSAADGEVRGELDGDGRHREHDPQAQEDPRFLKQTKQPVKRHTRDIFWSYGRRPGEISQIKMCSTQTIKKTIILLEL